MHNETRVVHVFHLLIINNSHCKHGAAQEQARAGGGMQRLRDAGGAERVLANALFLCSYGNLRNLRKPLGNHVRT